MVVSKTWVEERRDKESCLIGTEFQFCKMKGSGDLFYNVNVLNTTELYLKMVNMANFIVFLYRD